MKLKNIDEIDHYFTQTNQGIKYKFIYGELTSGGSGSVFLKEKIQEGIFLNKKLEGVFTIEDNKKTENKSKITLEVLLSNGDKELIALESKFGATYAWFNKATDVLELIIDD